MTGPLIINARHRLPWHQRLFSDASTAMAWGGWLWLWAPVLRSWATVGARSHPVVMKVMASGSADGIEHAVVALVGTSGALLVWNRLGARRARRANALSTRELARHFELSEQDIDAGRHASVCVVQHDDAGRIVGLECRAPSAHREAEVVRMANGVTKHVPPRTCATSRVLADPCHGAQELVA